MDDVAGVREIAGQAPALSLLNEPVIEERNERETARNKAKRIWKMKRAACQGTLAERMNDANT